MLPRVWTNVDKRELAELLGYLSQVVLAGPTFPHLAQEDVQYMVCVLVNLVNISDVIEQVQVVNSCKVKELSLDLLKFLFKRKKEMKEIFENVFDDSAKAYFYQLEVENANLISTVKSYYFHESSSRKNVPKNILEMSKDAVKFQAINCLPSLLKREWQILYDVLKAQNSCTVTGDGDVIESVNGEASVGVQILDILTLCLTSSNFTLDLQRHMFLSLAAVLSQAVTSLPAVSCQQLLSQLVGSQLLLPAVMTADLATCQHSFLATQLSRDTDPTGLTEIVAVLVQLPHSENRTTALKMVQQSVNEDRKILENE